MEGYSDIDAVPMEGDTLPPIEWTPDYVEDRLVEAMITCWRQPDRERAWLRVKSAWPEIVREADKGDFDARGGEHNSSDVQLRPAAMTRRDQAEMEQAFGWVAVLSPDDRKLVGLVISHLARGQREIKWARLLRPMGLKRGAGGIKMRYRRALSAICFAESGGNPQRFVSTPTIDME